MTVATHHQRIWHAAGWATCAGYFFMALIIDWFNHGELGQSLLGSVLLDLYVIYAGLVLLTHHGRLAPPPALLVIGVSTLCLLVLVLAVPPLQTDFYHYFFEDVAWLYHGQNPYLITPHDLPGLTVSQLANWSNLASQHGPARFYATLPAAFLGLGSPVVGPMIYKFLFALVAAGSMLLLYDGLKQLRVPTPTLGLLAFAWSPLVLYETQLSGGTDILMMFWLLLAISLLTRQRWYWALAALAISALTKYVTILLVPFVLYYVAAQQATLKRAITHFIVGGIIVGAIAAVSFLPFWAGPQIFSSTIWAARHFDANSVPGALAFLTWLVAPVDLEAFASAARGLFFIAYASSFVWLLSRRRPTLRELIFVSAFTVAMLLLTKSWFYPKYLIWLLPLLTLLGSPWQLVAVFLSGTIIFSPIEPDLVLILLVPPALFWAGYYWWRDNYYLPKV